MRSNNDEAQSALNAIAADLVALRKDATDIKLRLTLIEGYLASPSRVTALQQAGREEPQG